MKFTNSCFVRVEDAEKRKELSEWLKDVGRERVRHSKWVRAPWFVAYNTGRYEQNNAFCFHPELAEGNGYCDCGTNIPLFKALAAMNEDGWREQWFISNVTMLFKQLKGMVETTDGKKYVPAGSLFKLLTENPKFQFIGSANPLFRKATTEEIINYFKK